MKCYVGYSEEYKNSQMMEFREFYEQVPPKLMDCKAWHDKQENMKGDLIDLAEKKLKELEVTTCETQLLCKQVAMFSINLLQSFPMAREG